MRKIVFTLLLFLLVSILTYANTYYVAVTGNNSSSGTIDAPWGTWQKAFDTAMAGDTVYFRGGVWYPQTTAFQASICLIDPLGTSQPSNPRGHSGTKENPICYFNYPGEKPVLDCSHVTAEGNYLEGLNVSDGVHYIHFKGLEIRNVWQKGKLDLTVNGMSGGGRDGNVSNLTLENMSIHDIGGRGLWLGSANGHFGIVNDTMRIINSDFYNCADTTMSHQFNFGDGIKGDLEKGGVMILDGCRFWNTSDDGVDLSGPGQKILKNCWAFNIGVNYKHIYYPDDGNGFKLGAVRDSISIPNWIMTNCISAGNLRVAIHELDFNNYRNNARVYNSVFYKNEEGPSSYENVDRKYHNTEFYNCISYANTGRQVMIYTYPYPESNNSWIFDAGPSFSWVDNPAVKVTDNDFVSLDINELSKPRKADGSLPDVNFMQLVEGSDLIDAGTDTTLSGHNIGIPFSGLAPDMGVFEFTHSSTTEVAPPSNFSAAPLSTPQIDLSWQLNASSNPVMVAYSLDSVIGTPAAGVSYTAGESIPEGGVVLYNGSETSFSHLSISPSTKYYYKIWSNNGSVYSVGVTAKTTPNVYLSNTTLNSGTSCFGAADTLFVAGNNNFTVSTGATANFEAGKSIHFLPGFSAFEGSVVTAKIVTNGRFCVQPSGTPKQVELQSSDNTITNAQTKIHQPAILQSVKIYPNPNNGNFTLELTNFECSATISVINSIGTVVYQTTSNKLNKINMNLPFLSKGIYYVRISCGDSQFTQKLMKQ